VAPYQVIVCRIGRNSETVEVADSLYKMLQQKGVSVMYDDRDIRPGEMLADADLLGIPHRVVISEKTVQAKQYEYKARTEKHAKMVSKEELLDLLAVKK